MRSVTGKSFSAATVRSLHQSVDGWAAGLVVLLEREKTDRKALTDSFKRNSQEVFDYFAGAIFSKSDRETQEILLQTAYFPRFMAEMANGLTGVAHAADVVEGLAQEHYFTTRHGADKPTYRYHDLFREFLRFRANQTYPASDIEAWFANLRTRLFNGPLSS